MKAVSWLLLSLLCVLILFNKSTFCTLIFERDVINAMDDLAWPPSIIEKHILPGLVKVVCLLPTYFVFCLGGYIWTQNKKSEVSFCVPKNWNIVNDLFFSNVVSYILTKVNHYIQTSLYFTNNISICDVKLYKMKPPKNSNNVGIFLPSQNQIYIYMYPGITIFDLVCIFTYFFWYNFIH